MESFQVGVQGRRLLRRQGCNQRRPEQQVLHSKGPPQIFGERPSVVPLGVPSSQIRDLHPKSLDRCECLGLLNPSHKPALVLAFTPLR
eukprot:scaffold48270_cov69-Phaeocystis_antarctica.AAC.4